MFYPCSQSKALISVAVTAKLICVFVFAYAKNRFSYDAAHIVKLGSTGAHFFLFSFNLVYGHSAALTSAHNLCFEIILYIKGDLNPNDKYVYKKELYKACILIPVRSKLAEKWGSCGRLNICR